jgi:DNA-binding XRE family transcriptional regulator
MNNAPTPAGEPAPPSGDEDSPEINWDDPGLKRTTRRLKDKQRFPLRAVREASGLSLAEVAAKLGVSEEESSGIERNLIDSFDLLRRYAEALGATCEVVFDLPSGHRMRVADDDVKTVP